MQPQDDSARYLANIPRFYLFRALINFQLWLPIWVIYLEEDRGLSLTQITALDAPFWIAMVLLEVPTGVVADRWGRKVSLMYGAGVYGGAVIAFGLAGSFPLLLISYLFWGAAFTLFSGADAAFVYDSLKAAGRENDFQKVFGRGWAVQAGAGLAGLLVGAPLAEFTNLQLPIFLSGIMLGGAWLVTFTFHEPPRFDEGEAQLGLWAGTRSAASTVWSQPALRSLMFLAAAVFAAGAATNILEQPFLRSHDVSIGAIGWFLLPASLAGMGGALVAHRLSARFGLSTLVAALPGAVLGTAVILATFDTVWAFLAFPLAHAATAASYPVLSDFINRRVSSGQRATILSFNQLLVSLMLAPTEPILGFVADTWSLPTAYRVLAFIIALTAGPLLWAWFRASRNEPPLPLPVEDELAPATGGGQ